MNPKSKGLVPQATTPTPTGYLAVPQQTPEALALGWLLGYTNPLTRAAYSTDLRQWANWCGRAGVGLLEATRAHLEAFARLSESEGLAPATVARRLAAIAGFYAYATEEGAMDRNPAVHLRRPRVPTDSPRLGLDRNEARAFLDAAIATSARDAALAHLLTLNALRVSEACSASIADLDTTRGHRTLKVTRKRGRREAVPLAPPTFTAVSEAIGDRTAGPLLLDGAGARLDRHDAARIVARLAKVAGIAKKLSPHSLRHTAVTLALDAGVPLRDVQDLAGHADPRTTRRYDRARGSLDRHGTYALAGFLA